MSQSDKTDPKKSSSSKLVGEGSDPIQEGPSNSDTTEEVVSAVTQFFGIGQEPSRIETIKRVVSDPKNISKKAASDRNIIQTTENSESRRQPETSKALDSKEIQSPSSKNVNSGRIWTKSYSDRQAEQKPQNSERPSLDPTESVVSAVTQYFGIGGDENPTRTKKIANDQITARSQPVIDNPESSKDVRKQESGSKVLESKPTNVITKQKASSGSNTKLVNITSPSNMVEVDSKMQAVNQISNLEANQKFESARRSKAPTESVISAVTQLFGIGKIDKASKIEKKTDEDKKIIATGQESDENEQSQNQSKVQDTKLPLTVGAKHETILDSSMNETMASVEPSFIKNQSQPLNETSSDGKVSQRLAETGETSSKPVTIVPGSKATPSESVVSAVTDFFGISHSAKSAPVSKTSVATLASSSSQKRTVETPRTVDGRNNQGYTKLESCETSTDPRPGMVVTPSLTAATLPETIDKRIPPTIKAQPLDKQEAESSASDSKIPVSNKTKTVADGKKEISQMTENQIQDTPAMQRVSATTGASWTPAVVTGKQSHQSSNVASLGSMPRVTDHPKQPATANAADSRLSSTPVAAGSKVPSTPTVVVTGLQSIQSSNVAAGSMPQVTDQPKQPATANVADSRVSPTQVSEGSRVPSTPAILMTEKQSQQSSNVDAAPAAPTLGIRDQLKQSATAETADSKVIPTSVSASSIAGAIPTNQNSNVDPVSGASIKGPQTVAPSNVVTASDPESEGPPRSVPTIAGVPSIPVTVASSESSSEKPTVDAVSAASTREPQLVSPANAKMPKLMDEKKEPADAEATEAIVSSSPVLAGSTPEPARGVVTIPVTVTGGRPNSQKLTVENISAAPTKEPKTPSNVETPKVMEEQKPAATAKLSGPEVPPTMGAQTQPSTQVEESYVRTTSMDTTNSSRDFQRQSDAPITHNSKMASCPATPVIPTHVGEHESKKFGSNNKPSTVGEVRTDQSKKIPPKLPNAPVATPISEEPRTIPSNKVESPRELDVRNQPVTGKTIQSDESPTPRLNETATPVITPHRRTEDALKKMESSSHSQPTPPAASEKPLSPSPTQTAVTGKAESLQSSKIVGPSKTDIKAASSSPASATNVPPPATNVQDASTNRDKRPVEMEDQRRVATTKMTDSIDPSISATEPKQPQSITANAAETTRTMEAATTASSAAFSGLGVIPPPLSIIVNTQDRKQNDENNSSSTNGPPPTVRLTEPRMGVVTAGSTATSGTPSPVPVRGSHTSTATARQCWICFASDEDEIGMIWAQPCKCKGTTKWVHQSCLQMWVDEKLREHKDKKVTCPQCRTEYLIYLPKANILVRSLDQADNVIYRVCPFIAAGVVIGSFYWNAVTYGAIVMLQVAGSEGASEVAQTFQPTVIVLGLPIIPLSLLVFRLFQWEDSFLYILRTTSHCVPILQYILPGHIVNESGVVTDAPASTIMSFQRVLAGSLLTPIVAKMCGNLFFPTVESPFWRTMLGGALFISVKGLIKMYHKQQNYKRLSRRKILDYTEENKKIIEQAGPNGRMMNQVVPTPLRFQFLASVENRGGRRR